MEILCYGNIILDNIILLWRLISKSYISLTSIKLLQSDERQESIATK